MVALPHTFSQRFWLAHLSHICWCVIRDWGKEHDEQRVLGSGLLLSALWSLFSALWSLHSAPCSLLSAPSHCLRPFHLPSQGLEPVSGYHCSPHSALCSLLSALCSLHSVLCTLLPALCSLHPLTASDRSISLRKDLDVAITRKTLSLFQTASTRAAISNLM